MSEEEKKEEAPQAEAEQPAADPAPEQAAQPEKKEEAPQAEEAQTEEAAAPEAEVPAAEEKPEEPKAEAIQGKVKWFSNVKGFGFLVAEGQEQDIFVHYSSIQGDGYKTLGESEEVTFEVVKGPKGPQAANVVRQKKEAASGEGEAQG